MRLFDACSFPRPYAKLETRNQDGQANIDYRGRCSAVVLPSHIDRDHVEQEQGDTPQESDENTMLPPKGGEEARGQEQYGQLDALSARGNEPAPHKVVADRFAMFRFMVQNV
jgi:hypothetical protein